MPTAALEFDKFQVVCGDGIRWCLQHKKQIPAVVTSCPDMSEVEGILGTGSAEAKEAAYVRFFRRCAAAALAAVADGGYAIFVQTDRKSGGLLDKSYLVTDEAMKAGFRMMFHKITLIRDAGATDLYKPTFSHVLCYSRGGTPGAATPDVFARGKTLYTNGMGVETAKRIMMFLKSKEVDFIADPFVGRGTTLLIAKRMGLAGGVGVDIDREQCAATSKALEKN
jgi:hypothetical protein